MTQDNNPPNRPNLRVVENEQPELTQRTRDIVTSLRAAIDHAHESDCIGAMISLVKSDGSIYTITSATEQKHQMVAAALYHLLDVAGVSYGSPE